MAQLPKIKNDDVSLQILQDKWTSILNPLLAAPLSNVSILTGIVLASGVNTFNHLLGRVPQGWFITDINASATLYRSAAFNPQTLTLTSSAACTVNVAVF